MFPKQLIVGLAALTLSACWQSENEIYDASDYFPPVAGDLVTISDAHGPLGLYSINEQNQYVPVYTEAEPNSVEQPFRLQRFGFVPVDRMASYQEPNEAWQARPTLSRSVFPDKDTLIYVAIAEHEEEPGQTVLTTLLDGDVISVCSMLLQEGKGEHKNFAELAAMQGPQYAFARKSGIAMLVLVEITNAKQKGELDCDRYNIASHSQSALGSLRESLERGDLLREEQARQASSASVADAKVKAEDYARRSTHEEDASAAIEAAPATVSPRQALADLNKRVSDLQRESYEIADQLDGKLWGTVDGVGGKYYGVERRSRVNGLLFNTKMLCHNLSGYQSIFVTVTHDASPGTNAEWALRGETVPIQIETENGQQTHRAQIYTRDDTMFTNMFKLVFSDMAPSRTDTKYVLDSALLERTRRQAEMFGTSVEALTRLGTNLLSLEEAKVSETYKIYADIRHNGKVRSILIGDFGKGSESSGLSGFYDACLFEG